MKICVRIPSGAEEATLHLDMSRILNSLKGVIGGTMAHRDFYTNSRTCGNG